MFCPIYDLLVSKHESLVVKIKTYLKSDVLSMLADSLIALMTEAKHWFSITSTFLLASVASLTVQSSTYLKNNQSKKIVSQVSRKYKFL